MADIHPQTDQELPAGRRPEEAADVEHVYRALRTLLDQRGWSRGRSGRGHLTLDDAVDELLGTRVGDPASGSALARAARITRHLRDLSGAATLASWNDAPGRRLDEVHELLDIAGRAFPTD